MTKPHHGIKIIQILSDNITSKDDRGSEIIVIQLVLII